MLNGEPTAKFQAFLARQGLRMTDERRRVVEEVCANPDGTHFTVSELVGRLQGKYSAMGRATVYRTIPLLLDAGLIFEVAVRGRNEEQVYENTTSRRHHDHLTCEMCQEVVEFENESLHDLLAGEASRHGYRLRRHTLDLRGICASCRERLTDQELEEW
ncbi:MAG: transcriptional repressor [Deltaproteobacteria bacterium]|nr:transcriptional repressor [Deltaproteobacteria bacterium]